MQDYTAYAKQSLDFDVLPAGGYIAKIVDIDDRKWAGHSEPAHLIMMDIAEGEYKGIYKKNNATADKDRWLTYWFAEPNDKSPDWLLSKVGGIQTSLAESNKSVDLSNPHQVFIILGHMIPGHGKQGFDIISDDAALCGIVQSYAVQAVDFL